MSIGLHDSNSRVNASFASSVHSLRRFASGATGSLQPLSKLCALTETPLQRRVAYKRGRMLSKNQSRRRFTTADQEQVEAVEDVA
jgi:hypothetical protein